MLNAFKNIQNGKPEEVPNQMLYPLNIWFSSNVCNIKICNFINKQFFFVNPEILKGLLSLAVDKKNKFLKYPKDAKRDINKKIEMIKPYVKKIYGWSGRVFEMQKHLIDEKFISELNKIVGFSANECRALEIEFKEFKVEKPKTVRQRSLF